MNHSEWIETLVFKGLMQIQTENRQEMLVTAPSGAIRKGKVSPP